jgi:hypothetical protein
MSTGNSIPPELMAALRLLQRAMSGKAEMQATPGKPGARELSVSLKRAPHKVLTIRLLPWEEGGEPRRGSTTVWVLSPRDRAEAPRLRQRDESFVDLRGAVHLVLPWLLVDREGLKVRRTASAPAMANPFSDRNSCIVRLLLDDPERSWGIRELAGEAGVSPGTASKVVRRLALEGLAEAPAGRQPVIRLTDPQQVIRRWTRAYDWQRNEARAFAAPVGDPQRFLRRLPAAMGDARWALTLQAGASLVAPHASWGRVHVYVSASDAAELDDIACREGWPPAEDGRLVLMRPYYKHSVWHGLRTVNDLPVVSDTQLVLDLWHYPLRGMEQAEHILATRDAQR